MYLRRYLPYMGLCLLLLTASCQDIFEVSPNSAPLRTTGHNAQHITRIQQSLAQGRDTLRIAVLGDVQRCFDETAQCIAHLNAQKEADFVVQVGDFTQYGLRQEYESMYDIFSGLYCPWVVVVGNHDLISNGDQVYRKLFGPMDFCFEAAGRRFIFANTNSREFNFDGRVPDMGFVQQSLRMPAGQQGVLFIHVPPYHPDTDQALMPEWTAWAAETPGLQAVLFGHVHIVTERQIPANTGKRYFSAPWIGRRSYVMLTLTAGGADLERRNF